MKNGNTPRQNKSSLKTIWRTGGVGRLLKNIEKITRKGGCHE